MPSPHAIFFDLGNTLIYAKEPWQPVLLRANKSVAKNLIANGVPVDLGTFPYELITHINAYYAYRDKTLKETTTLGILNALLQEKGFLGIPNRILRAAMDAKYAITQRNWHLETDVHPVLLALKHSGYRLALISNAGDDPDVQALLEQHNLRPYFDFILTSAKSGYRKPHPYMFQKALRSLGVRPEQSLMVGDTLSADIQGANELGIYSVWANRRVNPDTKTLVNIRPKATIRTLSELPMLIQNLS